MKKNGENTVPCGAPEHLVRHRTLHSETVVCLSGSFGMNKMRLDSLIHGNNRHG